MESIPWEGVGRRAYRGAESLPWGGELTVGQRAYHGAENLGGHAMGVCQSESLDLYTTGDSSFPVNPNSRAVVYYVDTSH